MAYEFDSFDQLVQNLQALGVRTDAYQLIDEIEDETYGIDEDIPTYYPVGAHSESFDSYSTFDSDDYEYQQGLLY